VVSGRVSAILTGAAVAVAAAVACSSLDDLATPSNTDADASDATDATDATADTGTPSSSDSGDASTRDASDCDADICDDFDELPLGARWTATDVLSDASIFLTDAARSAPYALETTAFETDASNFSRGAQLYRRFVAPKKMSCTAAVMPLAVTTDVDVIAFRGIDAFYNNYLLSLRLEPGFAVLVATYDFQAGGSMQPNTATTALPATSWSQVTLSTDFATLTLSLSGAKVAELALPSEPVPGIIDAQVGVFARHQGGADVRYDDVRCSVVK
jgi:hypothetical protein